MKKRSFDNLVSLAQQEAPPSVNVADDVISTLVSLAHKKQDPYRAYAWTGTVSAAIAACIIVAATIFWQSNSDSVSEIMTYISWVAQ
jgi:hypothetical protein